MFNLIPWYWRALMVLALAAAVWGHGYTTGLERESDRRDAADLKRERADWSAFTRALAKSGEAVQRMLAADKRADDNERKWKGVLNATKNSDLAVANCSNSNRGGGVVRRGAGAASGATQAAGEAAGGDDPPFLVTWTFVGLWDGVWTGEGGEPVLGDPGGDAPARLGAAPFGPRDLLGNYQENAKLCAGDRRRLNALIDRVVSLRADWGAR